MHRRDHEFNVGDKVLLSTLNINKIIKQQTNKLREKFIGPYEILERIGAVAYKLKLPEHFDKTSYTSSISCIIIKIIL